MPKGGQDSLTVDINYTISQTVLQVQLQASAIGSPSTFSWGAVAFYWSGPFVSNKGNHFVDALSPFYTPAP
jgi:hypothetical protein